MSLMQEYISKNPNQLREVLKQLINNYNERQKRFLFIYAVSPDKNVPQCMTDMADYYVIHDLLKEKSGSRVIDFYLETPGGSAQAVEEIVKFLRASFQEVNFLICGRAMSAGTIMAMSGDEIWMTNTASLGPIDAQMKIGRSMVSAADYMEYIIDKRKEAASNHALNPVDANIIAQISPGELGLVYHCLEYAKDLVSKWLCEYKFKNWEITEHKKEVVTAQRKIFRAKEIAERLTDRDKWRTHGRAIKISDLEDLGLRIKRIDDDPTLSDVIYRIHTISRLLFDISPTYKILATAENLIGKNATSAQNSPIRIEQKGELLPKIDAPGPIRVQGKIPTVVELESECHNCGKAHKFYGKLHDDDNIDYTLQKKGVSPFPENGRITCSCGAELDLNGVKNAIESKVGAKFLPPKKRG